MNADVATIHSTTQQKRDYNDRRRLLLNSVMWGHILRLNTRTHVELVKGDERIQIIGPSENGNYMAVEVDDCILKFCGSADSTGRPSSGLCLKRRGNDSGNDSSSV